MTALKGHSSKEHDAINRVILEIIHKQHLKDGQLLMPDELMEKFLNPVPRSNSSATTRPTLRTKIDVFSLLRKAHHHAVDVYYDFISAPKKKGAPSYTKEYFDNLLKLRNEGKSYAEIAKIIELDMSSKDERVKAIDMVRKQLKTAQKKR